MEPNTGESADLLGLTADIVTAHLSHNLVATSDVPALIQSIHAALHGLGRDAPPEPRKQEPAVAIRSSVRNDYIVCLEDGAKLKMLKRYLRTRFNLSPEEYREKWSLPRDYPMVAPAYAAQRKDLAVKIGLGRKPRDDAATTSDVARPKALRSKGKPASEEVEA
jgi:predicted transcriptional regulator